MPVHKLVGCSAAAVVAVGGLLAPIAPTRAAMYPITGFATPYVQHIDCAAGFHIGPVGTCIIGTDGPPPPAVVDRRDDHVGCETKSVTRQDAAGNSETRTKTNC